MTLQSTGAISLNDIHIEAGGATGTTASINDADIRALIGKSSGATMSFSEWYGASSAAPISASGGTITTSGGYRYHKFTSNGTFSIASAASGSFSNTITVFICGGGGGASSYVGGGGGGARVRLLTFSASAGNKTVTVGSGGADAFGAFPTGAQGSTGGTSSVTGLSTAPGGGGSYNRYYGGFGGPIAQNGGASGNGNAGGTDSFGSDDGSSGGGGGYGAVGGNGTYSTAGNGGTGYTLSGFTASTTVTQYAGGGGGVCFQSDGYKNGGSGVYGGANGSSGTSNAVANRGGGGGGSYVSTAGDGGSGIVIFKYEYS